MLDIYNQFINIIKTIKPVTLANAIKAVRDERYHLLCKQFPSEQAKKIVLQEVAHDYNNFYKNAWLVYTLCEWRKYGMQIFDFSDELVEVLTSDPDYTIPLECLKMLPTKAFYIQYKGGGFWFSREWVIDVGDYFLLVVVEDGVAKDIYSVPCKNGQCITDALSSISDSATSETVTSAAPHIAKALQLVLYLATINADITVGEKVLPPEKLKMKLNKSKNAIKRGGEPKPTTYYIGKMFAKNYRESMTSVSVSSGGKKRPHIRRSHFHHFWTGSGDNRKLILKWVDTIFVNGESDHPTIQKIDK